MKTLSQILDAASQVRAEQQENENTAERVGGVLCDLTDFLQNKTALTGVNVRTNANGVSIEVRAQTGDGQESSTTLVFPKATETQAGIITAELLQTLRAGINGNSDTIQNLNTVLQDCVSKITAAQASIHENSNNIKNILAADQLRDTRLAKHGEAIENNQALLRQHRTDIADAKAAISAAQASIQENADEISAAEAAISAAQESIQENRERIGTLHNASEVHDTRLVNHGKAIEDAQALLREHRTDISAAKAAISAAQASIQENANDISDAKAAISAAQASIQENRNRIGTLHTASKVHDTRLENHGKAIEDAQKYINKHTEDISAAKTAISAAQENLQYQSSRIDTLHKASEKQDLSIEKNHNDIKEVKTKLDEYPSQFVLDLGTVSSQEEGESRAASSDVAGNRNISFIRFQIQGVSNLKTTLILQYPNGENYTAQIKFVDKAQWRRNVTGATGVKGAATTATQWERTAPHYLGYDAATRKIQLKDYTQTVSREVQLPLVSASSAGLFSPDMLSILEEMLEKISGYAEEFRDNPVADSGNISGNPRNGLMPSSALAKLENYPAFPFEINEVTEQQNGLMTSADKQKLDAYPSDPLKIPLATASTAGLLSNADYQKIQWLISERDRISNAINDIDTRLRALENK